MKTFVVVLREEYENVATVTLDDEIEEATPERAAALAKEWRQEGELSHVTCANARVADARAWEKGAACVLTRSPYSTVGSTLMHCATHPDGLAVGGATRCYEADSYEAMAPLA